MPVFSPGALLECGCDPDWPDHRCLGGRRPSYCCCGAPDDCYCPSPYERFQETWGQVDLTGTVKVTVDGQPWYFTDSEAAEDLLFDVFTESYELVTITRVVRGGLRSDDEVLAWHRQMRAGERGFDLGRFMTWYQKPRLVTEVLRDDRLGGQVRGRPFTDATRRSLRRHLTKTGRI